MPCQVIAFADDLVTPPHLGREVADAIPGAVFELIEGCGHYGYLEDPAAVNKAVVQFLTGPAAGWEHLRPGRVERPGRRGKARGGRDARRGIAGTSPSSSEGPLYRW